MSYKIASKYNCLSNEDYFLFQYEINLELADLEIERQDSSSDHLTFNKNITSDELKNYFIIKFIFKDGFYYSPNKDESIFNCTYTLSKKKTLKAKLMVSLRLLILVHEQAPLLLIKLVFFRKNQILRMEKMNGKICSIFFIFFISFPFFFDRLQC